jgi:hypothetical protein
MEFNSPFKGLIKTERHINKKQISELPRTQVKYPPTMLMRSTKLNGATPQKTIKLIARREPLIPNQFTINVERYKGSFFCLIAPYG